MNLEYSNLPILGTGSTGLYLNWSQLISRIIELPECRDRLYRVLENPVWV
jgi:hypothetical protein